MLPWIFVAGPLIFVAAALFAVLGFIMGLGLAFQFVRISALRNYDVRWLKEKTKRLPVVCLANKEIVL